MSPALKVVRLRKPSPRTARILAATFALTIAFGLGNSYGQSDDGVQSIVDTRLAEELRARPTPTVTNTTTVTKTATSTVTKEADPQPAEKITPRECLEALDDADALIQRASEGYGLLSDALVAAAEFNVNGIETVNEEMEKLQPKMQAAGEKYDASAARCRAAK